jgi:tetratricopeptide (TPR) repeat protein
MTRYPLDAEASHLMNHARTDFSSGRFTEAINGCKEALVCADDPRTRVMALQTFVESLVHMGRTAEANTALDELRSEAAIDPAFAYATAEPEGRLRLAERDYALALSVVRAVPEDIRHDEHSLADEDSLCEIEIKSLYFLQRPHEAAQLLRDCLRDGHLPLTVPEIADALEADGSGLAEVVDLFPDNALCKLLLGINEAPGPHATELLEAVWNHYGADSRVLTFAAEFGTKLPVLNALNWSVRLRNAGRADQCTLLALAANHHRTPRERALAAAVALEMFSDVNALGLLAPALEAVPDEQTALVLDEMRLLAPDIAVAIEPVPA